MNRRTLIGVLGATVLTGVAGCTVLDPDGDVDSEAITIDPADSALSADAFRTAAADSLDTYGAGGVWGTTETEPEHELAFQGAWEATLHHQDGVQSDHLLALYRLPSGPNGADASQVWLWSGVDPADAGTVRRISTAVSLPSNGASLGIYSPGQTYRAADATGYRVESGRLDAATLQTTMPLASGRVGVGERTRVGDGGAYAPFWRGGSGAPQSLAATTEVRWDGAADTTLDWTISVETTP